MARTRGVILAAATIAGLVLALLLLPQPTLGKGPDGCGEVESVSSRRDVNPRGLEPYAFGDSVMHPAIFELAERGFNANSRGCRSFNEGVRLLRGLARQDKLPHLVVMALGTDGRVTPEMIDRALGILGPDRVLGLVTPRESGGGAKFDAVTMRRAAARNPRQILLLDWVEYSQGHGTWFQPDGTHLTIPAGNGAFAAFLGRAIRFAREGRFSNGATIPAGGALPPPPIDVKPHGKCAGRRATVSGTNAAERLVGTAGRDVIVGFGGGDEIFSRGGRDLVCGGDGTDSLNGGAEEDDLHGGNGRDRILGGEGRDILRGQRQGDYLNGGEDADVLAGGPSGRAPRSQDIAAFTGRIPVRVSLITNRASGHGRDVMRGIEGILGSFLQDVIFGDEGPNSLSGAASRDVIVAGPGHDLIGAGPADDTVYGGIGNDTIFGAQGNDDLFGDAGADTIEGYAGNDEIEGGRADDPLLAGQGGDDAVLGGPGDDVLFGDFEPCRGPGCDDDFGDDDLNGGSGGESSGDQGDGGPHTAADSCVNLESQADCEALGLPRSSRGPHGGLAPGAEE